MPWNLNNQPWTSDSCLKIQNRLYRSHSKIHTAEISFHEAPSLGLAAEIHSYKPIDFCTGIYHKNPAKDITDDVTFL